MPPAGVGAQEEPPGNAQGVQGRRRRAGATHPEEHDHAGECSIATGAFYQLDWEPF